MICPQLSEAVAWVVPATTPAALTPQAAAFCALSPMAIAATAAAAKASPAPERLLAALSGGEQTPPSPL
ncbi:MAG TPA: hypothetical protein QF900_03470 [Arenicellales bacterium]|nr:hypothetical protein [Arenicellales bacterium]